MKKITIYSKDYCPYCKGAKQILRNKGLEFLEIDVEFNSEKRQEMIQLSGRTTVPQIFFGDKHVGGYDDLVKHFSNRRAA